MLTESQRELAELLTTLEWEELMRRAAANHVANRIREANKLEHERDERNAALQDW